MGIREDAGAVTVEQSLPSIYVAAHELKAPLVLIRQLALELDAESVGKSETVDRLLVTIERSLRLVEQLTRTSRLDEALFASEPLQAHAVCQSVIQELEPSARASGQRIVGRVSRRSGLVVGHRSLLTAVLVNLCDNALNHNQSGEKVILSARNTADSVVFAVRDFGPQISRKAFNAMQEQLGRGPLPLGERPRSSGLGLWITSKFVAAMGGELTMRRHHTAGITVSVRLPYSKQLSLL